MGKKSESTSAQTSTQIAEDNRLASSGLGNTGSISGSTVTDSSSNFDPMILENAFKYLGQSDAMMTDRAFATLAAADNSASNIIGASSEFSKTAADLSRDLIGANNYGIDKIAGLANSALGQSTNLATVGQMAGDSIVSAAQNFGASLLGSANKYTENAFKSGMDATGAAYNAVSEINSAASGGASVIPDIKNQVIVALVSGAVIYAFTRGK